MVGKPSDPSGSGRPHGDPAPQAEPGREDERVGVVAIARHRKGDGRALILYSRVEEGERT